MFETGLQAAYDYWLDAYQRSILFRDVLRERGNIYFTQKAREAPHVLTYAMAAR